MTRMISAVRYTSGTNNRISITCAEKSVTPVISNGIHAVSGSASFPSWLAIQTAVFTHSAKPATPQNTSETSTGQIMSQSMRRLTRLTKVVADWPR